MAKELFGKASLERLSSPEQIDRLLTIVRVPSWIALLSILLITSLILLWSIFGRIPTTVSGTGILFNPVAINIITSSSEGKIEMIYVNTGDNVKKGDVLATIYNPALLIEQNEISNKLKLLQQDLEAEKAISLRELKQKLELEKAILTSLETKQTFLKDSIAKENSISAYEITKELLDLEVSIQTQLSTIQSVEETLSKSNHSPRIEQKQSDLIDLEIRLASLVENVRDLTIKAQGDGVILDINVIHGQEIKKGSSLLWMESTSASDSEELLYGFFPINQAAEIKPGMKAQMEFAGVNAESYGKMIGTVKRVLPFAASKQGFILQSIPSLELREFLSKQSATAIVEIAPLESSNISGFEWTSGKGPPFALARGSLSSVNITIKEKRPISYLLPLFKA